jgi:TaqI-like C-terminal specificity domain
VIDFGDLQIFEGVLTYPAILTLRKVNSKDGDLLFMKEDRALPDDLNAAFKKNARPMPRARLGAGSWHLEGDALTHLRNKIVAGRKTLDEVYGAPAAGIKTGRNDAFVISSEIRAALIKDDPKAKSLIKPLAMGDSAYKWCTVDRGNWLIYIPRDAINIDDFPSIKKHLLPFKNSLERRALDQKWYELQQAQPGYEKFYKSPKIVFRDISDRPTFSFSSDELYLDMTCFCIATDDLALLSLINSKTAWFFWKNLTPELRGGFVRLKRQFVSQLPIPSISNKERLELVRLAKLCSSSTGARLKSCNATLHRILKDLAPPEHQKPTNKLENFWTLDFATFRAEVAKAFKAEIPVKDRDGWEKYLAEKSAEVIKLTTEIEAAEREIDALVYKLFDLTPDEIKLLEDSLER